MRGVRNDNFINCIKKGLEFFPFFFYFLVEEDCRRIRIYQKKNVLLLVLVSSSRSVKLDGIGKIK